MELLTDPSSILMVCAYVLGMRAHRLQFGALLGPPGTGKTRIMTLLFSLHLCSAEGACVYWVSGGNATIGTTVDDIATAVPDDAMLREITARPTASGADDDRIMPSPLDVATITHCEGKRFLLMTTGVLTSSPFQWGSHKERATTLGMDEGQQATLRRDQIAAKVCAEGGLILSYGDAEQPHRVAATPVQQTFHREIGTVAKPGLLSPHLRYRPRHSWIHQVGKLLDIPDADSWDDPATQSPQLQTARLLALGNTLRDPRDFPPCSIAARCQTPSLLSASGSAVLASWIWPCYSTEKLSCSAPGICTI